MSNRSHKIENISLNTDDITPIGELLANTDAELEKMDEELEALMIEKEIPRTETKQISGPAFGAATLVEAAKAMEDRQHVYGSPLSNFERIARRWRVHLANRFNVAESEIPLTAQDVSVMMVDVKLARLEQTPDHHDSWVDVAGYAGCGAHIGAIGRGEVEGE